MNANCNRVESIGGAGRHREVELALTQDGLLMRCEAVADNQHGRFPASLKFLEPLIQVENLQSVPDFPQPGAQQWTLAALKGISSNSSLAFRRLCRLISPTASNAEASVVTAPNL